MSLVDAPTIAEQKAAEVAAPAPALEVEAPVEAPVELPLPPAEAQLEPQPPAQLDVAPEVHTDTWVVRFVVLGLMAIALAVVVGEIVLLALQRDLLPGEIVVLGSAAVGGLGGVLASTRSTKQ